MGQRAADVVVVGGGILGRAIALELLREGARVTMIYPRDHGRDSATLAAGAMIGAFGELTPEHDGPSERARLDFRIRAQDLHPRWLDALRQMSGRPIFSTRGIFMIARRGSAEDARNLQHIRSKLDEHGRRWEEVDPGQVPGLAPSASHAVAESLFLRDDLTIDAAELMDALAAAIAAHPRSSSIDERVLAVEPDAGERGWVVRTRFARVSAPNVVVCAGARVPEALGEATLARLRLPVLYFAKGIGCVVSGAPPFPHAIRTPNRAEACGLHVVPRAGGRLYIGASNHYGYASAAARGVTPGELGAIVVDAVRQINEALRDTTVEELRFGLRPMTGDDAPLLGATPLPGLFLGTGTWRTGIVMAPLAARVVAAEVLGRPPRRENPFAMTAARAPSSPRDLNVAHLHVNVGLEAYHRARQTNDEADIALARAACGEYVRIAGEEADPRIVALIERLAARATIAGDVW
ncbi:uncharacterized protein SOCEGT47_043170 [Sorangium cellulosum]|uniref:FAD dependent oxidoreductase domain-containing protein n=1 Tax=Sorangium cellulosum TaxID=56 RepID=A0A4P2Q392_SORCE|nr:FAD-dependent oxidoreductase [Sorangium cellulosum]AUX23787.1 uncharacterized protein SOCEGT47_043170 [Sorangium cellulosum]